MVEVKITVDCGTLLDDQIEVLKTDLAESKFQFRVDEKASGVDYPGRYAVLSNLAIKLYVYFNPEWWWGRTRHGGIIAVLEAFDDVIEHGPNEQSKQHRAVLNETENEIIVKAERFSRPRRKEPWSRTDKLAFVGIVVAVAAILVGVIIAVTVPEARQFLGLEKKPESTHNISEYNSSSSHNAKNLISSPAAPIPQPPPERTTASLPNVNSAWIQTLTGGRCENGVPDITHGLTMEQFLRRPRDQTSSRGWGLNGVTAECESNQLGSFAVLKFPPHRKTEGSYILPQPILPPGQELKTTDFWIRWNSRVAGGTVKWVISKGCISTNFDVPVPQIVSITDVVGESPLSLHTLKRTTPLRCKPGDLVVVKLGRDGDQDSSQDSADLESLTIEFK
jgi:hypothetical protein